MLGVFSLVVCSSSCQYLFHGPCGENICMDFFLAISLFPKSVTTAMAVGITEKLQGLTTVTLVVVVATGILTSVIGPTLLKWLKIDDPVAVGLSLGGTGHAVGTGNNLSIRLCSRSYGWFGYRCYRYSLCLCQPYRSQFDIELKARNLRFLAFKIVCYRVLFFFA